jgi:membrane-anchored protein YejM (alkaline phosphatase superfamily)
MLKEQNVLFITLDSCRFDTAEKANIPNIRAIGKVYKAFTPGSYTVPAHVAFFAGHLPNVLNCPEQKRQLWKIQTGRVQDFDAEILLDGKNIIEGYKKMGFYILGVGGVTQFNTGSQLRDYFGEQFLYYGLNLDEEPLYSRKKNHFALNYPEKIVQQLKDKDKWFLFINCPETHYPYDFGDGFDSNISEWYPKLTNQLNEKESEKDLNIPDEIYKQLHTMQIRALESLDEKLGELIKQLPSNREILVIICGDHGESFGEEFEGRKRWGHIIPAPKVMQVPFIRGIIK